jgi:hypothetical protein
MGWINWLRIIDHISRSTQNIKTVKLYLICFGLLSKSSSGQVQVKYNLLFFGFGAFARCAK